MRVFSASISLKIWAVAGYRLQSRRRSRRRCVHPSLRRNCERENFLFRQVFEFLGHGVSSYRILFFLKAESSVAAERRSPKEQGSRAHWCCRGAGVAEAIGVADSMTPVMIWFTAAEEAAVAGPPASGRAGVAKNGVAEGAGARRYGPWFPVVRESDG